MCVCESAMGRTRLCRSEKTTWGAGE